MAMIKFADINKTYMVGGEPLQALKNISMEIDAGEYISVMGSSGSGKSTLLNIIGLLDRPDSGSYRLDDDETRQLSEEERAELRRENIGFIFQSFHLVDRLTAFENVELPMILAETPVRERRQVVARVLRQVGLEPRAHHRPSQLSGGQLQRVAIARAIVMRPRILLADEPTGNLDLASGREVIQVLEQLNAEGITLLIVTHDRSLGRRARRLLNMTDGAITSDETFSKLAVTEEKNSDATG